MSAALAGWLYLAAGVAAALLWLRHVRALGVMLAAVVVGVLWPLLAVAVVLHVSVESARDRSLR